jgi:trigger factor
MSSEESTALADLPETEVAAEVDEAPARLDQKVEITDAGPCRKHVKVTVERAAIATRMDEKFSDLMLKNPAHVPGFRPGKAPRKIVVKKFAKEIASEVKNEILMRSLEQLAEEQTLSPLSPPELDPSKVLIPEGETEPMVYEFNIEVRPEFELPDYKGLKIRRPIHTFTPDDIARETKRILEPYGTLVPKEGEGVTVAMDDLITADLVIKDGENELNKVSEVRLKVEKRLALEDGVAEDFGKKLVGAKVGDTRVVDITLSQGVNTTLRGKVVAAHFTILDIKTVRLPELTADLLAQFEVRNPDQFEELVATRLERFLEYQQRQTARTQVLQLLAGSTKWELPQDLLQRQARKTLSRRVMEMRSAGMTEEQIVSRERALTQDAMRSTAAALQEHFVLQKIADLEKLEIEDPDIEAEIDAIADRTGESPRKVRGRMEREDLIESLATELLERKALDLVLETATYEDYEYNPMNEDEDATATSEATATDGSV